MRYFIELAYRGTEYRGWQRQPGVPTVQLALEDGLRQVLGYPVSTWCCGRTDAGVHADQFFVQFDTDHPVPENAVTNLANALPPDIAVYRIFEVPKDNAHHVQRSAIARTYEYHWHRQPHPFRHLGSTYLRRSAGIDINAMQAAARLIPNYEDFRGFCKVPEKHNHTRCDIHAARIERGEGDQFYFSITANRFLRGMIRLLAAQLLDVGMGKMTVEDFDALLAAGERPPHFNFAPPEGLHLVRVRYGF
ncbi:MAG: tRNA pseudouridine synthase A [Bacteroidota bacterium]